MQYITNCDSSTDYEIPELEVNYVKNQVIHCNTCFFECSLTKLMMNFSHSEHTHNKRIKGDKTV